MQTLKRDLLLPAILTVVFVVSSFIPVIQILILTFDGGLIASFERMVGDTNIGDTFFSNIVVNLLPVLFLLSIYWKTAHNGIRVVTATFSMILMTAFLFFLTDGIEEEGEPYFLNFLIIAIISGAILTSVSVLKLGLQKVKKKAST